MHRIYVLPRGHQGISSPTPSPLLFRPVSPVCYLPMDHHRFVAPWPLLTSVLQMYFTHFLCTLLSYEYGYGFFFHFGFERLGYVVLCLCMRLGIYYHSVHDRLMIGSPCFHKALSHWIFREKLTTTST
jgi:hypothetical protein